MNFNGLEVTDVIVKKTYNKTMKLKATAKLVLNDQLIINGIGIEETKGIVNVIFPYEKNNISCYPATKSFRDYLAGEIINAYMLTSKIYQ